MQPKNKRFNNKEICDLIVAYQIEKKKDPNYRCENRLANILMQIVNQSLVDSKWRGYTPDWKDDMRSRAFEIIFKYGINSFSPEKTNDAYNYFCTCCFNAFKQIVNAKKEEQENSPTIQYVDTYQDAEISEFSVQTDPYDNQYNEEIVDFSIALMTAYEKYVKPDIAKYLLFRIYNLSIRESFETIKKKFDFSIPELKRCVDACMQDMKKYYNEVYKRLD